MEEIKLQKVQFGREVGHAGMVKVWKGMDLGRNHTCQDPLSISPAQHTPETPVSWQRSEETHW